MNQLVDKPMGDITPAYLDKIKAELNCVGVILIISDSQMPCPDSRAGEDCPHGHEIGSGIDGFSPMAAMAIMADVLRGSMK